MNNQDQERYDNYIDLQNDDFPAVPEADHATVELMRLLQLENLLDKMQVECVQTAMNDEAALRVFLNSKEDEISFYLNYHAIDIDSGSFILEAVLPMSVLEDKTKAAEFCMNYNTDSIASTAYWKEGRLFLRLILKELELPVDERALADFFEEIKHEYAVFSIMAS